ncbi:unnamed protein product [Clonostachys chloroleuca]|uniref:Uncharacterized protein n=1 Tax=Clonostachys chloroleuca TaxID=1926264 RepID=A0AA35MKM3_9HYPO|nr:unnamed protein product [Clonostachys chloroleuca]
MDIDAQAVGDVLKSQGMATGLPFAISNLDLHYDGGIQAKTFPPPEAAEPLFVIRHLSDSGFIETGGSLLPVTA